MVCALESGLGLGLILTASSSVPPDLATAVRAGTGLFFLLATAALVELRQTRPDVGCGCFGDLSTAPVSGRTLARSALLTLAALATIGMQPITASLHRSQLIESTCVFFAELVLIAALSPEVGEALIRLGYSEPCEVRTVPTARTLTLLRRSKPWRRYADLVTADLPVDVWRELCWRYVVYPATYLGDPAEIVFAVFLQQRRPVVHAALVDGITGLSVPWPSGPTRSARTLLASWRLSLRLSPRIAATSVPAPRADLPFSSDL
jgi:hypothetical protein